MSYFETKMFKIETLEYKRFHDTRCYFCLTEEYSRPICSYK